jgi:GR25 family glycosyltransferase involved in LPS biosynthesis
MNCLVWLQTTTRRDNSRTVASIESSDIGQKYIVLTDNKERVFPKDYGDLQSTWHSFWQEMIVAAKTRNCQYILRLEDDVIVNQHIMHNLRTWPALKHPRFGYGTLFCPNYWLNHPQHFKRDPDDDNLIRNLVDVEGGQGQIVKTETIGRILEGVPLARAQKGFSRPEHPPSFDWAMARSAWNMGLRVFVHKPSLVDLHDGSRESKIDEKQNRGAPPATVAQHYWGNKSFDAEFKRSDSAK